MSENEAKSPHLQRVVLKGYKSIKSAELEMGPINILIGANGSGKSNFISLFSLLRHLSQGKFRTYIESNGGASVFLHFGPKHTSKMIIEIDVGFNGYHVEFAHNANDDLLIFEKEYCTVKSSSKNWSVHGRMGESGLLPGSEASSDYVRRYTREYMQGCRVYHFHDTSAQAGFKRARDLSESHYLHSDAGNLGPFLHFLRKNWSFDYQNIVSCIQTVAPFFHDFYLEPRESDGAQTLLLKWIHKDHDEPFSANQLSDGTARFICMAALFLQPQFMRPNTIVLDEPELGLHPAALDVLAEIIVSASKMNQVICSTQSIAFANKFDAGDFIVVDQEKGVSKLRRLDSDSLAVWLEDYGVGDIWAKNLIGGRPEW